MPQDLLDSFGAPVARPDVVLVAVPLLLLSALATHLTSRAALHQQPPAGPAAALLRAMPWVLPLGVLAGGALLPLPVAIGVYWLTSNAWTLAQQHVVRRRLDRTPASRPERRSPSRAPGRSRCAGGRVGERSRGPPRVSRCR